MPALHLEEFGMDVSREFSLELPEPGICSLYHGRVIEGARASRSPGRLRYRLNAIGVRSISNLVDVTNYILMELGQPLHAFDLDAVRGKRIIVRGAEQGEILVTLDGQERTLLPADITIRDTERAIGLGGVMGGLNSEITATSSRVFLECAVFDPIRIRKTARRLSLHSEAAYRFERGVDQVGATYALERAASMMAELSGGKTRAGLLKIEPEPWKPPTIRLRRSRAEALLGVSLNRTLYADTLSSLGCEVRDAVQGPDSSQRDGIGEWDITPPSYRRDLTREADLIEEVIRIYGVDRVPPTLPVITRLLDRAGESEPRHDFLGRIRHWGRSAGLHEAVNYSFVSHRELDLLAGTGGSAAERPESGRISIMNPLSDDMNVLRTDLAPGLLNSLRNNLAQGADPVRLFEVAAVFTADPASETTARESPRLGIILHGARFEQPWPHPDGDLDYLDLKGLIEHLLASFSLPEGSFSLAANNGDSSDTAPAWLSPCVRIGINGEGAGWLGKVKADLADPYHAKKAVWLAEIDLDRLFALSRAATVRFAGLPVFPPVRRDITVITPPEITAGAIIKAIRDPRPPLLSSVLLIDCFEPEGREERNLTFRLTFRHAERTLKDAEADKGREAIAKSLQNCLPVRV
jgi:phenylalanyl-tRNA synthetase beta chain